MAGIEISVGTEMAVIRASGLFSTAWYLARHPDLAARGEDGVEHFCTAGWREGAQPNPYFHTDYYLANNRDVAAAGFNPLWHYIEYGEFEGRNPAPFFFAAWYRKEYGLGPRELCLAHFLPRRLTGQVNPVPVFNAEWYLENNPDIAAANIDPFEHFLAFGPKEGRDPAPDFDVRFYQTRYAEFLEGQNPLLHYLANRDTGLFLPARPVQEKLIPGAVRFATRPADDFENFQPLPANAARRAKLLAFYLPQFHDVPENDAWWGKGFTDWTNLGRAVPRFAGHLQPRVPRDLGYYSLDDPNTLQKQIKMAAQAGLSGFVFYYYWFNGHRLLEKPLEQMFQDKSLDFPFCVMWANENWTRRWDGLEREVLIAQEYRERDDEALIASFARLFADARYIRVQGRPVLMIYRVTLIPNAASRIAAWREMFRRDHGEDPVIIMAQSLGDYDPAPYGLDGAVEFPPHKLGQEATKINPGLDLLDPDFTAAVYDYAEIAKISLDMKPAEFPLIKTIVPGWDNDPRREGQGLVLHNTNPAQYQAWLEKLVDHAVKNPFFGERIICVNAWNEWAEGAFLEPDIHFGAAYLNATGRALCDRAVAGPAAGILLVGHDAHPHGAQLFLLHIARHLRRNCGMDVHVLLLGVGPLLAQYYETASVTIAYDKTIIGNHLDKYRQAGIRTAIVNSAASARVVPWAAERGIAATLLVHEMPRLLKEYNLEISARRGAAAAAHTVFSSDFVRKKFCAAIDLDDPHAVILPQGNYQRISFDPASRKAIRKQIGLPETGFMVLGVGFADFRKGFDLFVQLAGRLKGANTCFVWVGEIHGTLATYLHDEMAVLQAAGAFHHIGFTDQVQAYYSAADIYALTSREDPYPTVALEALAAGIPCIAFDGTGGIPDLLRNIGGGGVVPLGDVPAFAAQISSFSDHKKLKTLRPKLQSRAAVEFDFPQYMRRLMRIADSRRVSISVCVLNYNYAKYLPGRLQSIFAQTYPVEEVLAFDDASTDDSVTVMKQTAQAAGRDMTVIANARNSGAIFEQWRRAAETAQGEYVWIAEADDACEPAFLASLVTAMSGADRPIFGFTDSRAVDENGGITMRSYQSYYFAAGVRELAASRHWPAGDFARKFLGTRNLILNVSAVLWRRDVLLAALASCGDELRNWRLAGDWRLYLQALAGTEGSVVYVAAPLNTHRRHAGGATQSLAAAAHVAEIRKIHAIAAEILQLDPAAKAEQAAYVQEVETQFGLKPPQKPLAARRRPPEMVARKRKV